MPAGDRERLRQPGIIVLSFVFQRQVIRGILSGSLKAQNIPTRQVAGAWG